MSMVTNAATSAEALCPGAVVTDAPYRFVDVATDFEDVLGDWRELYPVANASCYQSFEFVSSWFETLGRDQKLEPMIVVARDAARQPLALLPLALERRGYVRIVSFVGGSDSNFNLGLFRRGVEFSEGAMLRLLQTAGRSATLRPDLYFLRNQPSRFDGVVNPLVLSASQPSPSSAYGTALPDVAKALDARQSKDTRKKLRRKEARLAELGEVRYEHRASGALASEIARSLIEQKSKQFGSRFESAAFAAFLERLSSFDAERALELHALTLSGRIVATYAGLAHRGRFSAMLNSYDMDEQVARCSPGELLLHALLRNLVARGFTRFDLGVGEARYKNSVCEEKIDLYDMILPITLKGAAAVPVLTGLQRMKGEIKRTAWMARLLRAARRLRSGSKI
jgi:CelD/BcsL family acetyltransferase involved in cellulose biosynthesis